MVVVKVAVLVMRRRGGEFGVLADSCGGCGGGGKEDARVGCVRGCALRLRLVAGAVAAAVTAEHVDVAGGGISRGRGGREVTRRRDRGVFVVVLVVVAGAVAVVGVVGEEEGARGARAAIIGWKLERRVRHPARSEAAPEPGRASGAGGGPGGGSARRALLARRRGCFAVTATHRTTTGCKPTKKKTTTFFFVVFYYYVTSPVPVHPRLCSVTRQTATAKRKSSREDATTRDGV